MLSFTSSLSPSSDAFVIFVTEKYGYKDKKNILAADTVKKINSFISVLRVKKKEEDINSFDISNKQKCFIIKVKHKYENSIPQESGGAFFSYLKKFKDIKKIAHKNGFKVTNKTNLPKGLYENSHMFDFLLYK